MKKACCILTLLAGISLVVTSCAGTTDAASRNVELYTTSFETFSEGQLSQQVDGNVEWVSVGKAEIMTKFHHTGAKSLHIFGGQENTVELALSGEAQSSRGIRFQAERWSSKSPFKFRIQAQLDGEWKEASNLDQLVDVGARFKSDIIVKLPAGTLTGLRLMCTAPEQAGVLIDDFKLLETEPANVSKTPPPPKVATEPIRRKVYDEALFVNKTLDTHTYRIPAIITAQNGDLIATCDARRKKGGDLKWSRDIDIVVRRSSDNGKTWSDMEVMCDYGDGLPASDPSLILDESTGEIFCFYNYMDRDNKDQEYFFYVQTSKDHGKTWSEARDITAEIAKPGWKMDFKFITSGRGIQTRDGELLHTMVNLKNGLHIFGSKDHGKTWYLKDVPIKPGNESKVIELADGRLMVNCRANGKGTRWVHVSDDRGESWKGHKATDLVDPGCNGSILRYTSVEDGYAKNRLIFSNANSAKGRKNLAVRISYDEGKTWSDGKVITTGKAMYSDLTICPDGSIGILWEPGNGVQFTSITLEDLTDGKDKLSKPYQVPGTGT